MVKTGSRTALVAAAISAVTLLAASVSNADIRSAGFSALSVIDARAGRKDGTFSEHLTAAGQKQDGPSTVWAAGVQLSALNAAGTIDRAWIRRANDYAVALDAYRGMSKKGIVAYQPFPGFNGGDLYYDDNAWLVMAFLDTYALTGDREHIRRAVDAYVFLLSGETDELGGGIFWRADKHESKNTCVNAPAICAALELYRVTGDAKYLADAKRLLKWTQDKLQDADALYFDAIGTDQKLGKTKWSYNAALMIRANGSMFETTKERRYLDEALRIAAASEAKWFRASDGALMDEASFAHLLTECLLYLDRLSPVEGRRERVVRSLEHLQTLAKVGTYPKRWDGWKRDERRTELLTQASAARGFLFAANAIAPKAAPTTIPAAGPTPSVR